MQVAQLPATLSVPQVARILGVSRNHAYVAVRRGEIPAIRVGRRIVVPTHRLLELLSSTHPQENASPVPVGVFAETADDQFRMVGWLRRSSVVDELPAKIKAVLDRLDEAK
jgi:excisionase family DNA binding protein